MTKLIYPVEVIDYLVEKYEPRQLAELFIETVCGKNIEELGHEDLLAAFGEELGRDEELDRMYGWGSTG